jgi:hypothetical protein
VNKRMGRTEALPKETLTKAIRSRAQRVRETHLSEKIHLSRRKTCPSALTCPTSRS